MRKSGKQLTIFCRNCKYFNSQKVDKDAILYSCKRTNENFSIDEPELANQRSCFKNKIIKGRDKDG